MNVDVVLSLRGLTQPPPRPYAVRVGGFGGADGLADELRRAGYGLLIDASHPFASRLAGNAAAAAARAGVPRLRVLRPPWQPAADDRWLDVDSLDDAARHLAGLGRRRVFLAVGQRGAAAFGGLDEISIVLRSLSPMPVSPIPGATVIVDGGPFTVDREARYFTEHRIDVLVARNSGGSTVEAKLVAARRLEIPVVMVRRPPQPEGDQVPDVDRALAWVAERIGSGP